MPLTVALRSYVPLPHPPAGFRLGKPFRLQVSEGTTLDQLMSEVLKVPTGRVALIAINREGRKGDYILAAGDRVDLFPPIGGG